MINIILIIKNSNNALSYAVIVNSFFKIFKCMYNYKPTLFCDK